jgi:hypothetical protein
MLNLVKVAQSRVRCEALVVEVQKLRDVRVTSLSFDDALSIEIKQRR